MLPSRCRCTWKTKIFFLCHLIPHWMTSVFNRSWIVLRCDLRMIARVGRDDIKACCRCRVRNRKTEHRLLFAVVRCRHITHSTVSLTRLLRCCSDWCIPLTIQQMNCLSQSTVRQASNLCPCPSRHRHTHTHTHTMRRKSNGSFCEALGLHSSNSILPSAQPHGCADGSNVFSINKMSSRLYQWCPMTLDWLIR